MNTKRIVTSLALVAGLAAAAAAQAEGKIYVGAKLGSANSDITGFTGDALTAGIYGGYNMLGEGGHFAANLNGGSLAVEGEALTTTVSGKGWGTKWDVTSLAAYAAYRHPIAKDFYVKARAGLVHYTVDVDFPPALPAVVLSQIGDQNTLALGIGAGWKIGPGRVEADVTTYNSDMLIASVGFHMNF